MCVKYILADQQLTSGQISLNTRSNLIAFVSVNDHLLKMSNIWKEQLKSQKTQIRQNLITGQSEQGDGILHIDAVKSPVVTLLTLKKYETRNRKVSSDSILPVVSIAANFPNSKMIIEEFTLNREQRAAFMIIACHADGDLRMRTGFYRISSPLIDSRKILFSSRRK